MASNKGRLLLSIMNLSTPKLGLPYTRPEPASLSASNSLTRLFCSSTQHPQQPPPQDQQIESNKLEGEESETKEQVQNGEVENEDDGDELDLNKETGEIGGPRGPEPTRIMQDVSSLEAEIGVLRDGLQLALDNQLALSKDMDALAAICLITVWEADLAYLVDTLKALEAYEEI
ncbi:hypothetical protein RHSIM_Rhsim03G0206100 [Rhododendron simsii]|uniref:Succinate dehydrogenase assembly factor 4, mitochondrial n=1 Tax=Rhododendron simsii TaxID=118357 RepID=A0A834H725_RHOSS|nr:hypothetical protein RHSIM_Rhsim03G0206100 [Rhododendron simsii]